MTAPQGEVFHATTVAINGKGVLILGPSGSGKSGLALQLLALGAVLVADDRSRVICTDGRLIAHAPPRMAGVIEARNVGLIRVPHVKTAPLHLAVDMTREEPDRLPHPKSLTISGMALDLLWRVDAPHFPSAIWQLVNGEAVR
ncbi:serine kinase [Aliiroseovarius sp.]|uniref:HPr kinase/phosphorylase n=1 Tax=Aliiroseovarius sp. TaxID=1872442 RepID=UPI002638AA6D|nr:serine kinase [Aliiroseovarius sp.]